MTLETFGLCGREPIRKNRARTFNEVICDQDPHLAKRLGLIAAPFPMPKQAEIDEMVAAALAKHRPGATPAPLPRMASADPVETMIRKAETGAAHPAEIDAVTNEYVQKAILPEDRGSVPQAYERLAKANDKGLNRLYAARTLAAVTFGKNAVARVADRDAAQAEAARIEAEINRKADELRAAHPGRFTPAQAMSEVLAAEKELYSRWIAAKQKATR